MKKPVALIIMDGIGLAKASSKNAVSLANTPTLNYLIKTYPKLQLRTDGEFVGLPKGQMGNSEVGHLNIGAGRIVRQSLSRIDYAIEEDSLKEAESLNKAIAHAKENDSAIHLLGLISDGGVHSQLQHIIELYKILKEQYDKVYLHGFSDGRDVGQKSIKTYIQILKENDIELSSIAGRFYAMDRDKRWERIQKAYDVLVDKTAPSYENIEEYIDAQYEEGIFDEFILPAFDKTKENFINDNDAIVFANYRPDRARELSHYLLKESKLYDSNPEIELENIYFTSMTSYAGIDVDLVFPFLKLENLLGDTIAKAGLSQIRGAETEKYPHVTFFMDGGVEVDLENQLKILVDSPKVATYDLQPEMSAIELTDKLVENFADFDAAIINFANADMVGHTGSMEATIKSVETVDQSLQRIYDKVVKELDGILIVIADHGNADEMIDEKGEPMTKHSLNPVPLIITSHDVEIKEEFLTGEKIAKLANVAPTMLKLLKLEQPEEMDEESLIK